MEKVERRNHNRIKISGDNGKREPPVPIPNTEVKPLSADGTWLETARESRSSPDSKDESCCEMQQLLLYMENECAMCEIVPLSKIERGVFNFSSICHRNHNRAILLRDRLLS